jgi:hypothetical protein
MHYKKISPSRAGIMTTGTGKTTGAWVSLSLMLAACNGGDGGGTASFTSWSSIQPNSTVVAQGMSQEDDGIGPLPSSVTSTVSMTFDANRALSELILPTSTTRTFNNFDAFAIQGWEFLEATNSTDLNTRAVIADPFLIGYEYQTFGVWETQSASTSIVGAFSAGAPTPVTNIPTVDGAGFTGNHTGIYFAADGFRYYAFGGVDVTANFAGPTRSLEFNTFDTVFRRDLDTFDAGITLEIGGTLTYDAATNTFSGPVASFGLAPRPLTGSSTGQFYGPSAQELGGLFSLQSTEFNSVESYSGAYGAKVTP